MRSLPVRGWSVARVLRPYDRDGAAHALARNARVGRNALGETRQSTEAARGSLDERPPPTKRVFAVVTECITDVVGGRVRRPLSNGGAGAYSIASWIRCAVAAPNSSAARARPKSIPAVTPAPVTRLRSHTTRCRTASAPRSGSRSSESAGRAEPALHAVVRDARAPISHAGAVAQYSVLGAVVRARRHRRGCVADRTTDPPRRCRGHLGGAPWRRAPTVATYVRRRRIERARAEVARADRPLSTIALDAGFGTSRTSRASSARHSERRRPATHVRCAAAEARIPDP
jgi:AraC-like DNA-binding protein